MRRLPSTLTAFIIPLAALAAPACGSDTNGDEVPPEATLDETYGKPVFGVDDSAASKADSYDGAAGPKVAGLTAATAAWKVTHNWADKDNAAGIAWGANSGLTWDEKYAKWIESLPKLEEDGETTFTLTTPWGKTLPAPRLECAETAMFLRVTFASWYGLPFYMTAYSSSVGSMYFGHFGIVATSGARISGYPSFANDYKDYTSQMAGKSNDYIVKNWPKDTNLRKRILAGNKDDDNSAILGAGAYTGAYLDEMFLNKRAAYLLIRILDNFGSVHLASQQNTFNLKPTAIREGDTLLERWQKNGIGHTIVVRDVVPLTAGKLSVEVMYGSMPRIQPEWFDANLSKPYFTSEYTGGEGTSYDGDKYAALGGGLKRWRTAIQKSGRWYNVVPTADRVSFVDGADLVAIAARPAQFEELLGSLSPEEQRDVNIQRIQMAREALQGKPASCSNRERREAAFDDLYELMSEQFGMSAEEVDRQYRVLDDYVFPEMVYNQSKTCCWNSTTADMYLIIMQLNQERVNNEVDGQCQEPIPFYNNGGYKVFADYAAQIGMGDKWKAWTEDEPCAQKTVAKDTEATHDWAPFCDIKDDVLSNTDASE
ncbi:MAG: hypothetical protein U1F43_17620 [Myxococcota bacterium]